jgi:peptide chain release factor subunit 1
MTASTLAAPILQPPQGANLAAQLKQLAAIEPGRYDIISCYVRLEPGDRSQGRYLMEIKTLAAAIDLTGLARDRRLAVERDFGRIVAALEHPAPLPRTRGMALFACEALDLFTVVPLLRVHRTRVVLDNTPWLLELVAAERDLGTILVVAVDRTHARLFRTSATGVVELPAPFTPARRGGKFVTDRADAPGWGEHRYHSRLEEERHRHYAAVVEALETVAADTPNRGVLLVGPADHTAALRRFLPERLATRLLGTRKANPRAVTPAEIQALALDVAAEHHGRMLADLLRRLDNAVGAGWAVNDARETLRALARGQLRTLLVRGDFSSAGYRCQETGRLVLAKIDCSGEGEPAPVRDLVDEAVEEALRQGVEVVVMDDQQLARSIDGLAGFLRFR